MKVAGTFIKKQDRKYLKKTVEVLDESWINVYFRKSIQEIRFPIVPVNLAVEEPGILDGEYDSLPADDSGEANNCRKFYLSFRTVRKLFYLVPHKLLASHL